MALVYHVTPWSTWTKKIKKEGLLPRSVERGMYADSNIDRVYFFVDRDTVDDAMDNWLVDKFPTIRWFAVLEVEVPDQLLKDDPEIAGSMYVDEPIPAKAVRRVEKVDAGEPE